MHLLDYLAILLIFGTVLYIGFRATKKTDSSEEFLLAGRSLGKIQAGFSMAASDMGGSAIVGAVGLAYIQGVSGAWYNWGAVFPMFILGFLIAKQLRSRTISSVPELLGKRYSNSSRLVATITQILATAPSLGIQLTVSAAAISAVTGIDYTLSLIISATIVAVYTIGGGLLAVVNTDVFQFCVILLSIAVMIPFGLEAAGGIEVLRATVPPSHFDFGANGFLVPISFGLLYMFDYATMQAFLQRIFAAKDAKTAAFGFHFTGAVYIIFGIVVAFLGVIAYAILPGMENNTDMVYTSLVLEIMPNGLRGLAMGGIFAATMSTADTKLMATSHLFINDIYTPIICKGKKLDEKHILNISRITTLVVCLLGIGVSLFAESIVGMMYLMGLIYGTAVFVPMLGALYWKRGTSQGAVVSIICTAAIGVYSEISGVQFLGLPSNLFAVLVSLATFIGISLITPPPSEEKLLAASEVVAE